MNKDKIFKGQHANEEFVCFFRHHWITLLKEITIFILLISLITASLISFNEIQDLITSNSAARIVFVMAYIAITFFMHRFFIVMLNYFVDVGIITDMRIIDHQKTIFFKDIADSIDLTYIQNIEQVSHGVLSSMLKYGSIKIFLASSVTTKTFHHVPNPKFHFRCLNRQKEIREKTLPRSHQKLHHHAPENHPLHVPS